MWKERLLYPVCFLCVDHGGPTPLQPHELILLLRFAMPMLGLLESLPSFIRAGQDRTTFDASYTVFVAWAQLVLKAYQLFTSRMFPRTPCM